MAQRKGQTGNPSGRPKGTPNKITAELREIISDFLIENWPQIEKDFKVLDPEKRVALYEKFMQFTIPRMQSVHIPDLIDKKEIPMIKFVDFSKKSELNNESDQTNK